MHLHLLPERTTIVRIRKFRKRVRFLTKSQQDFFRFFKNLLTENYFSPRSHTHLSAATKTRRHRLAGTVCGGYRGRKSCHAHICIYDTRKEDNKFITVDDDDDDDNGKRGRWRRRFTCASYSRSKITLNENITSVFYFVFSSLSRSGFINNGRKGNGVPAVRRYSRRLPRLRADTLVCVRNRFVLARSFSSIRVHVW